MSSWSETRRRRITTGHPGSSRQDRRVAAISGPFFNPESRAHGGDGLPKRRLCSVEFRQIDLWGERYRENGGDRLLVDIYEHWLSCDERRP